MTEDLYPSKNLEKQPKKELTLASPSLENLISNISESSNSDVSVSEYDQDVSKEPSA
jgi:hypothetical protein